MNRAQRRRKLKNPMPDPEPSETEPNSFEGNWSGANWGSAFAGIVLLAILVGIVVFCLNVKCK